MPPGPLVPFAAFSVAYWLGVRAQYLFAISPPNRFAATIYVSALFTVVNIFAVIFMWSIYRHLFALPRPPKKPPFNPKPVGSGSAAGNANGTGSAGGDDSDNDDDVAPEFASTGIGNTDHLWTIHNKRYDLSDFVAKHPGGESAILLGRGRNCTILFETYHSLTRSGTARIAKMLEQYKVGPDVCEGDPDFDTHCWNWSPEGAPFYTEVVREVRRYFGLPVVGVAAEKNKKKKMQQKPQRAEPRSIGDDDDSNATANANANANGSERQTLSSVEASGLTKATIWKWMYTLSGCLATVACLVGVALGDWLLMLCLPIAYVLECLYVCLC